MTIHSKKGNQSNTFIHQSQEVTTMQNNNSISTSSLPNKIGAQRIASLALWNQQFQEVDKKVDRCIRFLGIKGSCVLVVGAAGTGKTHYAHKKVIKLNAGSVCRGDYNTMPALVINAPKQSTELNLILKLLYELGDIKPKAGSLEEKKERLTFLLKKLEVELIIIDEIHDFLPKSDRGSLTTGLLYLKELMEVTRIPMLFLGTEKARRLTSIDKEISTRIRYPVDISRMPYGPHDIQKFDFAEMATSFAENLPKTVEKFHFVTFSKGEAIFSNSNMLDRFYVATNGLPRGLRDMFLEINIEIEDNPEFTANLSSLASIYAQLSSMNDHINFNPFDVGRLDDVRNLIGYTEKGADNEAA